MSGRSHSKSERLPIFEYFQLTGWDEWRGQYPNAHWPMEGAFRRAREAMSSSGRYVRAPHARTVRARHGACRHSAVWHCHHVHVFTGVQYALPNSDGSFSEQLTHSMTVISIQSQVAYGHVGTSAGVFPMQMRGIDVIAVPTTLLSNRPGYPTIRGKILDADLVADLLAPKRKT
jgi:hypothetical protein